MGSTTPRAWQSHRGKHPEDARLFAARHIPVLRAAVADFSFLLSRRYAQDAALKTVGDHYQLDARQRRAVLRASCSDAALDGRAARRIPLDGIGSRPLALDGYNLLITVESALAGGVLVRGRDGCVRDMSSVHGSYRKVEETLPAIRLIGETLEALGAGPARWLFDAPVSNRARARGGRAVVGEEAERQGWDWEVELAGDVDRRLSTSSHIVVTADGWILDRAARWANLTDPIVATLDAHSRVIDLGGAPDPAGDTGGTCPRR